MAFWELVVYIFFNRLITGTCYALSKSSCAWSKGSCVQLAHDDFTLFDKLLFHRFSASVATQLPAKTVPATTFKELIKQIGSMMVSNPVEIVHEKGKAILVRLFPSWLLTQYRAMFARPFPRFSAWMNSWVTHFCTHWLMGNSTIFDIYLPNGSIGKEQGLLITKCRFFEEVR